MSIGAVFWVGGGLTLTILALRAERSSDPAEIAMIARQAAFVGEKLFAPAGLHRAVDGHRDGDQCRTGAGEPPGSSIGLVGYAITFVTGLAVFRPRAKRIGQLIETMGAEAPETQAAIRRILLDRPRRRRRAPTRCRRMVLKPFT